MRQMISLTGGRGHNSDRSSFVSWCEIHSVLLWRCFEYHRITAQTTALMFVEAVWWWNCTIVESWSGGTRLSSQQEATFFRYLALWAGQKMGSCHKICIILYIKWQKGRGGQWQVKPLRSINRDTRTRVLVAVCHRMCKRLGWDRWKSLVTIDRMLFCCIFCCSERGWWNWWWLEQKDERVSDFTSNHCLFEDSLLLIMKSHVPHDHGTILDGR